MILNLLLYNHALIHLYTIIQIIHCSQIIFLTNISLFTCNCSGDKLRTYIQVINYKINHYIPTYYIDVHMRSNV